MLALQGLDAAEAGVYVGRLADLTGTMSLDADVTDDEQRVEMIDEQKIEMMKDLLTRWHKIATIIIREAIVSLCQTSHWSFGGRTDEAGMTAPGLTGTCSFYVFHRLFEYQKWLGLKMTLDMDVEVSCVPAEEEAILASFTKRLIEIAAVSGARGAATSPTAALNAMRLPAIALDQRGFVVDANAAAEVVFDNNIRIKDRRLFVRDPDSRNLLKEAIDQLTNPHPAHSVALEPVIVPRDDKLPVIVRIWPFERPSHPGQEVHALLTLNALGPRPGPPATILAKTFCLTPSEAKLACIIARGAPPAIAARELKISRETARNQLKSVFAKTDTHRQSELVALLMQVG
jgi:DNA-binding CsgD family transcriptional regulator